MIACVGQKARLEAHVLETYAATRLRRTFSSARQTPGIIQTLRGFLLNFFPCDVANRTTVGLCLGQTVAVLDEQFWLPGGAPVVTWNKDRAAEWIKERIRRAFAKKGILLIHYTGHKRPACIARVSQAKAERKSYLSHGDICQIICAVEATRHVPGQMAEFGVAHGTSARIIAEYGGGRLLHLFDTFEGLPEPGPHDSPRFCQGSYSCSLESVQQYLSGLPVACHKGFFPGTAKAVEAETFSFVHLDVDLYESTLEGLKFFYPRMARGGILISHDYQSSVGVDKAFAEFFRDKPEPVVGLSGYQCLVTKL